MIDHCHPSRCAALLALLVAAALFVIPQRASAQGNCTCEFYTVKVDAGVPCRVTVCVLAPSGTVNCVTITPGTGAHVDCTPGGTFGFRDCHGNFVPFNPVNNCHLGIGAGPNCCTIDACIDNSVDCPIINIRPSILDVCPCP